MSGLIWVRGLAVRHQAELREPLFVAASSQVKFSLGPAGANARPATAATVDGRPDRSRLPKGRY